MGKLYAVRRNCLVQCLERQFQGRVHFFGDEAGLHLLVQIKTTASEKAIVEQSYKYGVKVYSAGEYYITSKPDQATFLLGYANLTEHQIYEGIERFAYAENICRRN
ncbi:HTH-type transcriptional regulatory protein GabR [compost metagenome]